MGAEGRRSTHQRERNKTKSPRPRSGERPAAAPRWPAFYVVVDPTFLPAPAPAPAPAAPGLPVGGASCTFRLQLLGTAACAYEYPSSGSTLAPATARRAAHEPCRLSQRDRLGSCAGSLTPDRRSVDQLGVVVGVFFTVALA